MRTYIPILFLIFFAVSCQNEDGAKSIQQIKSDTVSHPESVAVTNSNKIQPADDDFSDFWKRFRTAVIASDTNQIVAMTQFPFKTRGPLDYDPTVKFSKGKFIPVFYAFLNQWNGQDLQGTTELDDIRKTETPDEAYVQKEHARVGNLVFKRTKDEWKLVFAYLNNETIDSLQ